MRNKVKRRGLRILQALVLMCLLVVQSIVQYPVMQANAEAVSQNEAAESTGENLALNPSFENTLTAESGNLVTYFKDGIYPESWTDMWIPAAPNPAGSAFFSIDNSTVLDGANSLHYTSENTVPRMEVYSIIPGLNMSHDYIFTGYIKTDNVVGTGAYFRAQAVGTGSMGDFNTAGNLRAKGTQDWTKYTIPIQNLPAGANRIKLEIFMEYLSGDVWVDNLCLERTYRMTFAESEKSLLVGNKEKLELVFDMETGLPAAEDITWSSSNEKVVKVDQQGNIEVVGLGFAAITAEADEYHKATCNISSDDPTLVEKYPQMIAKWADRLTGNNMKDTSDPDYIKTMQSITKTADDTWKSMVPKEGTADTRETLWSDLNLTVNYVATSDGKYSVDFDTAFNRIEDMALAYAAKGSSLYGNEQLKTDIIDAMEWMYVNVYNDSYNVEKRLYGNWWHWQIGMPQSLANITILMYNNLSDDLIAREAATLKNFNEDPRYVWKIQGWGKMDMTSANLMDTALVSALRGIIEGDVKGLGMAGDAVSTVLPYVESGDGFYQDGSCIQHSVLAYTGGYGATLLNGLEKIMFVVDDSPFAISDPNIANVYEWIWNGYRPLFAYGAMMDMVTGRGIARPSRSDHSTGRGIILPMVEIAKTAPEGIREEMLSFIKEQLQEALEYNPNYFDTLTVNQITSIKNLISDSSITAGGSRPYHKIFSVMDKAVHHAENFSLGISMYSKRTGSFEFGNGENLKGWHMSDGALYLYTGDQSQYAEDYWPTVDPHRLAGITTDHTEGTIPSTWTPHVGNRSWVGGTSLLGLYGATGMDFEIENSTLNGKKSWFTFDDEVVALGAGISSEEDKAAETIIDNRKIKDSGDNKLVVDGKDVKQSGVQKDAQWAYLEGNVGDSIGYYFPGAADIEVVREARTGNWRDINTSIAQGAPTDKEITKQYVSLAVDHGKAPKGEKYAYVLIPNASEQEVKEYAQSAPVKVLSNTDKIQAAVKEDLGVTGINFWEAGTIGKVTAKNPASVMLAEEDGMVDISISDPTQESGTVAIVLEGIYQLDTQDTGVEVTITNTGAEISVNAAGAQGSSFTLRLKDVEAMNQKILDEIEALIENAELGSKADLQNALKRLEELKNEKLTDLQRIAVDNNIREIAALLKDIEAVEAFAVRVNQYTETTPENADDIEKLYEDYEKLTAEQKQILPKEIKDKVLQLEAGLWAESIQDESGLFMIRTASGVKLDIRTVLDVEDLSEYIDEEELQPNGKVLKKLYAIAVYPEGNGYLPDLPLKVSVDFSEYIKNIPGFELFEISEDDHILSLDYEVKDGKVYFEMDDFIAIGIMGDKGPKETEPKETEPKETDPKETDPKETDPKETDPKETKQKETDKESDTDKIGGGKTNGKGKGTPKTDDSDPYIYIMLLLLAVSMTAIYLVNIKRTKKR